MFKWFSEWIKKEQTVSEASWSGEFCQQLSGLWWAEPHSVGRVYVQLNLCRTDSDRAKSQDSWGQSWGKKKSWLVWRFKLEQLAHKDQAKWGSSREEEKSQAHTLGCFNSQPFYSENNKKFMIRAPTVPAFSPSQLQKKRIFFNSPNLLYPKDCTSSSSAKSSVWHNQKHDVNKPYCIYALSKSPQTNHWRELSVFFSGAEAASKADRGASSVDYVCVCVCVEIGRPGSHKATGCGFSGLLTINSNYTVLHNTDGWRKAQRTSLVIVNRWDWGGDRGDRKGWAECVLGGLSRGGLDRPLMQTESAISPPCFGSVMVSYGSLAIQDLFFKNKKLFLEIHFK